MQQIKSFPEYQRSAHFDAVTGLVDMPAVTPPEEGGVEASRVFVAADVYNPDAVDVAYLQVFARDAVTVGAGGISPIAVWAVPPLQVRMAGHGWPLECSGGLSIRAATTRTGSTIVTTAVSVTVYYR